MDVTATTGTKMQFLISRRPGVTRDELAVNWFANHMAAAMAGQTRSGFLNVTTRLTATSGVDHQALTDH